MTYYTNELYHHGIKGQKWGVRRYQNADGSLTAKGIKRYAIKGYTRDAYNHNKTKIGKAYDRYTGSHKLAGKMLYDANSSKKNKARAEKYLNDKKKKLTDEDFTEYKYSKPGESGWVGAGRAIKAKNNKRKADKLADKLAKTAVAYNQQAKSTKTIDKIKINDEPITIQQLSRKDTNAWYKAAKKADRYGQKLERRGYQTSISSSQIGKGKQYVEAIVNGEVSRKYI